MIEFVVMTLSFTAAILLAMGLSFMIMTDPRVVKWYMKHVLKSMDHFTDLIEDQLKDES